MNLIRKWLEKRKQEREHAMHWKEYQKWRAKNIDSEFPGPSEGFYKQLNGNGDMGR